jgi:hypothetical protein
VIFEWALHPFSLFNTSFSPLAVVDSVTIILALYLNGKMEVIRKEPHVPPKNKSTKKKKKTQDPHLMFYFFLSQE